MAIPFFLDFDDTLFDTKGLKRELDAIFTMFGATAEQYQQAYLPLREPGYEPLQHARGIWGKVPQGFEAALETVLANAGRFTYPDAERFLQHFPQAYRPVILTKGSSHFQHQKIQASKLADYFSEILVCQEEKWLVIQEHVSPQEPFILADDRTDTIVMLAQTHPKSYGIVIDRLGHEPRGDFPLFQIISNFTELKKLPSRLPSL